MALNLIQFQDTSDNDFIYGVLKEGVTQDQIFKALQSDDTNIDLPAELIRSFIDTSYEFDSYLDFVNVSNGTSAGVLYAVNYYQDFVHVQKINNGLGGVALADRDDTNTVDIMYTIADYKLASELFSSVGFAPNEFLSGVVAPIMSFAASNSIILALLSVTFIKLGVRIVRRLTGSFGRGR